MKLYMIFGSEIYYPNGGAFDLLTTLADKTLAINTAKEIDEKGGNFLTKSDIKFGGGYREMDRSIQWSQVLELDTETGSVELVYNSGERYSTNSMIKKFKVNK